MDGKLDESCREEGKRKLINISVWHTAHKILNVRVRMINGNIGNTLTVIHWNLGGRNWENKIEDVQALVDETNLDICFISEVNLFSGVPNHMTLIEGYDLTLANTMETLQYSRLVLLTKKGLQFTLEENRMEGAI